MRDLRAYPEISEIRESGTSFEENATLKALAASKQLPALVIADDSGLEVDALGGAPGIYSARYAGANATEKEKIDKLLARACASCAPQRMRVELDFAASWRSRVTAISSEPSKELWKEESPIKREATADLVTTRFSFRKDSSKRSVNCPPK